MGSYPTDESKIGYVTIEYANTYVREHLLISDEARQAWSTLHWDDKEVLLRASFAALERLPYRGRKTQPAPQQTTAFPRWPDLEVPRAVQDAQCANAVALASKTYRDDAELYERLRQLGVSSYSVGNVSETLREGGSAVSDTGIHSAEALRLLSPYLRGGFSIL